MAGPWTETFEGRQVSGEGFSCGQRYVLRKVRPCGFLIAQVQKTVSEP